MGDEIPMKNFIKFCLIYVVCGNFAFGQSKEDDIKHYDKLFESLSKQRQGLSSQQIKNSIDPFIKIAPSIIINSDTNTTQINAPKPEYVLYAILNKRAKINDEWYSIGDQIKDYTLVSVSKNSVSLSKSNKAFLKLELKKGNQNVLITKN